MYVNGTILKWGNSVGIRLNKSDLAALNVHEREQVRIQIRKIQSPLAELYGLTKREKLKISRSDIASARKELEGSWGRR